MRALHYGIGNYSKIKEIKKNNCSPIFEWLSNPLKNGWNQEKPTWNFCKYLIGKDGKVIRFFASSTSPLSSEITSLIK